jgi:leucyl-tRNA synthetase
MRRQLRRLGLGYDWRREISTCDPSYYRWNQWFFLRMLERGLAYRARRPLNWCGSCETVLANEQVVAGRCWRCEGPVAKREFEQWFLRITDYAEELLRELDRLEHWPEKVRTMQRNWIGRSEGARVLFPVEGSPALPLEIFTTRIDTIYGATYVALAAEHPALDELVRGRPEQSAVEAFVQAQLGRSLEDRFAETAEKQGVFTGRVAVNPFSGQRLPIWVANFVLMDVGTGAIMSVPAHDTRDLEFARVHDLAVRPVVQPVAGSHEGPGPPEVAFTEDGVLLASGPYTGLPSAEARRRMTADAEAKGFGSATVSYRLKDWGVSRQRYWGTPIPVVYCERCGVVPVPEAELPVLLPPEAPLTGAGGSPLAHAPGFVETRCPGCGGAARRETDTMDTFVDSSWYYFRYLDPNNEKLPFAFDRQAAWLPADIYIGGIEHATLHLIYTRFWTKMMRELGLTALDEPVRRLFTQGMVIKDGAKMSKSKGNVVDPDQMVERYGADTTRLFSLFAAPPERDLEWNEAGVEGCYRFLARVWRTFDRVRARLPAHGAAAPGAGGEAATALRRKTHQTIQRVTDDLGDRMHLNTAVAATMELINATSDLADSPESGPAELWAMREAFEVLALLLAPFAPHFAEELWEALGGATLVSAAPWPRVDRELLVSEEALLVVQVNGKVRARLTLPRGASEEQALAAARAEPRLAPYLEGKTLLRSVHVPDRLLNLVVQ